MPLLATPGRLSSCQVVAIALSGALDQLVAITLLLVLDRPVAILSFSLLRNKLPF